MTWVARAACRGIKNPDAVFYPVVHGVTRASYDPYTRARELCSGCPVRDACLEDVLARKDTHGFRAGLEPDEIKALLRRGVRRELLSA